MKIVRRGCPAVSDGSKPNMLGTIEVSEFQILGGDRFGINLKLTQVSVVLACLTAFLCGCQPSSGPVNPNVSGNWQISFTPTSGSALFPDASGYIKEDITDNGASKFTTAELTETSSAECFVGGNAIFATGTIKGTEMTLDSASVNGQSVEIYSTLNASSTQFTGTYQVAGGCANGSAGSVSGTEYAPLTGTYSGSVTGSNPAQTIQLQLTQNGEGNGNGDFLVAGTLLATGFSCFNSGTITVPNGFVSGSSAQLDIVTNDASDAQLILKGNLDQAAGTLTLSTINVTSGACAGLYGTATLTR